MAAKVLVLLVLVILLSVGHVDEVHGQAPAPADAAPDCFTVMATNLGSCLTFVEPNSNLSKPEKECCPGLSTVLKSTPQCLCQLLTPNASADLGFDINSTKARTLPSACHLSTPPLSLCSYFGVPIASPVSPEGPTLAPVASPANSEGSTSALAPAIGPETTAPPPERSSASKVVWGCQYSVLILIGSLIKLSSSFHH